VRDRFSYPFLASFQVVAADMHGRGSFIDFYDPAEEGAKEEGRGVAKKMSKRGQGADGVPVEEEEEVREGGRVPEREVSRGGEGGWVGCIEKGRAAVYIFSMLMSSRRQFPPF
jgi:hypothetical protein